MQLADDLSRLEVEPTEYVCEVCHLVHLKAARAIACDRA